MSSPPRLHPQYRAVIVEGRGALLLSGQGDRALSGRLFERLIPLIDGEASSADLALRLEPEHSPAEVFYTLSLLEAQGFLTSEAAGTPAAVEPPPREPAPAPGQPALAVATVIVGALPAAECLAALERRGLRRVDTAPFTLVLTDSYLRPELAGLDAAVRAAGGVWLPARLARDGTWIGPVFRYGSGPCWQCLEHRLSRNRPLEYHLLRQFDGVHPLGSTAPDGDALDAAIAVVAGACAAAIQRPSEVEFADAILAIELPRGIRRRHPTLRRPQCPGCGDVAAYARVAEAPIVLRSRPKGLTAEGGHRETAPEVTLATFGALVDPLTGVVHDVEQVPAAEADVVYVCAARFGADPRWENGPLLDRGLRQSAGKGITEAQARVSSLGEAIERYSWAYQGDEPRCVASLEELGGDAIHPNACMLFSDTQYAARSAKGPPASRWHVVPPPLDPGARIDWTPVWSLSAQCRRYLPTMLLYGGYPSPPERAYCIADPSGSAAGNSREEAVLQGLLELVERDALSIWWYNRIRRPAIALEAIDDPYVRRLVSRYERQGRTVWALYLTTDLGIPAFAAVSRWVAGGPDAILLGFGAHLDPTTALTRALLELAQIDVQVGCAEREGRALDPTLAAWLRDATVGNQPYLEPAPGPATALAELPCLATDNLREDIALCQRALARAGIELLLLDQTRPDIGVPVVKVVAPGLRHFRPRFAPGRLYDVPAGLGWLAEPRAEAELNPIPFFL
jgi:bacteriocin biosynthesis cyclodehydratase domain-containing protein